MICLAVTCAVVVPHIETLRIEQLNQSALAKLSGSWLAVEKIESGRSTTNPDALFGRMYDKKKKVWQSWGRRDELSPSREEPFRIDATKSPTRLDFPDEAPQLGGKPPLRTVLPCIFKIDGQNLVVAHGKWADDTPLKPGADYPGRPKDFTSTKENGVTVVIFKPSSFLAQD